MYVPIDNDGLSPFYAACAFGQTQSLDWLLYYGVPSSEMFRAGDYNYM